MSPRPLLAAFGALALSGCSYVYDLLAVVIDGRLAFVVDPHSRRHPECIQSIHVLTDEPVRARPTLSDDKRLVANGVFWWKDTAIDACPNPFPVFYGVQLKGKPFVYQGGSTGSVDAKPLRIGVVYEVDAVSSGSGIGGGRFRILPNRRVENLPPEQESAVAGNVG